MVFTAFVKAVGTLRKVLTNLVIMDTNILMQPTYLEGILRQYEDVHIPVEVLAELDHLKSQSSSERPESREKAFKARCAIRAIKEHIDKIKFLIHEDTSNMNRLSMIVDDIIIEHCKLNPEATLITNDINMEIKARALGIDAVNFHAEPKKNICSVSTLVMTADEYQNFVISHKSERLKQILIGQFVNILGMNGDHYGTYRFLGENMWDPVAKVEKIKNYLFDIESRDVYQASAIKSLHDDEFTVITGPAGTGKTLLSLGYCLERMHKEGAVIHIFVNPVKTRGSEALGFYPGDRNEKLLSNFIGGVLSSKLGDSSEIYRLLDNGGLRIYPFSDIRGIEIGAGDIMYITEAQNLSVDLMKLAIQRCAEGSKLVVEGDCCTQVDSHYFEGANNGLQRVIDIFTGTTAVEFGYINLPIIYRSRMANKAEEL